MGFFEYKFPHLTKSELRSSPSLLCFFISFCVFSIANVRGEINTTDVLLLHSNTYEESDISSTPTLIRTSDVSIHQYDVTISNWNLKCRNENCYLQLNSSVDNLRKSLENIETLFRRYVEKDGNYVTIESLANLMKDVGILQESENHEEDEEHESEVDTHSNYKCIESIEELWQEFDDGSGQKGISLSQFYLVMPRLIQNLQNPNCKRGIAQDDHELEDDDHYENEFHEEIREEDRGKVWGIALVSVAVISLLSVVGILTVPLMGFTRWFNTLLSFLVALAVGTLVGDALLHLLPHAMGGHEHDHSDEEAEEIEKMKILKSLVAVLGVYIFFIFESGMSIVRKRKRKRRSRLSIDSTPKLDPVVGDRNPSDDFLMVTKPSTDGDSLLYHSDNASSNKTDEEGFKTSDSGIVTSLCSGKLPSTSSANSLKPLCSDADGNRTSSLNLRMNSNFEQTDVELTICEEKQNEHHHHHHHGDIANAQGIKDLAWMIIAGDGLHNFSDGLAIGAAFSSSISAGMSTSLAIFFHELPHELGDFAILIDAGMSIKKALVYNGLCACLAFVGAIIGLLIGEHTSTVKLWILAVTAGGFLYVALVDMLPQMLRQCVEKDGLRRFIFQNIGFLSGVIIMLLIAWFEESFSHIFNISGGD